MSIHYQRPPKTKIKGGDDFFLNHCPLTIGDNCNGSNELVSKETLPWLIYLSPISVHLMVCLPPRIAAFTEGRNYDPLIITFDGRQEGRRNCYCLLSLCVWIYGCFACHWTTRTRQERPSHGHSHHTHTRRLLDKIIIIQRGECQLISKKAHHHQPSSVAVGELMSFVHVLY